MTPPALAVRDLSVRYGTRVALRAVTFEAQAGELIACIGPNGAGKSTLFRAIIGLVPHDGTVALLGSAAHDRQDRLAAAYVAQRSDIDLSFPVNVREVVAMGLRARHRSWTRRRRPVVDEAVTTALARVQLTGFGDRPLAALSGGELQRVLIARALVQDATVLLLDEALAGVDQPRTHAMLDLFSQLSAQGMTVIVSTHDLALARHRFSRVLALNGRLVADGPPAEALDPGTLDTVFGSAVVP